MLFNINTKFPFELKTFFKSDWVKFNPYLDNTKPAVRSLTQSRENRLNVFTLKKLFDVEVVGVGSEDIKYDFNNICKNVLNVEDLFNRLFSKAPIVSEELALEEIKFGKSFLELSSSDVNFSACRRFLNNEHILLCDAAPSDLMDRIIFSSSYSDCLICEGAIGDIFYRIDGSIPGKLGKIFFHKPSNNWYINLYKKGLRGVKRVELSIEKAEENSRVNSQQASNANVVRDEWEQSKHMFALGEVIKSLNSEVKALKQENLGLINDAKGFEERLTACDRDTAKILAEKREEYIRRIEKIDEFLERYDNMEDVPKGTLFRGNKAAGMFV